MNLFSYQDVFKNDLILGAPSKFLPSGSRVDSSAILKDGRATDDIARVNSRSAPRSDPRTHIPSAAGVPLHPPPLDLPLDTNPIWGAPPNHELQAVRSVTRWNSHRSPGLRGEEVRRGDGGRSPPKQQKKRWQHMRIKHCVTAKTNDKLIFNLTFYGYIEYIITS